MFSRPLTGSFSPALVATVLAYVPAHGPEHLVHAWDAIGAALREDSSAKERARIEYARARLACAKSEPVQLGVKPRQRKAFLAEVQSLEAALTDYVL